MTLGSLFFKLGLEEGDVSAKLKVVETALGQVAKAAMAARNAIAGINEVDVKLSTRDGQTPRRVSGETMTVLTADQMAEAEGARQLIIAAKQQEAALVNAGKTARDAESAKHKYTAALRQAAEQARKTALAIGAVTVAFVAMVKSALESAVALRNFNASTGGSTAGLQRWQRVAAGFNVSGEEVAETMKSIAKASADLQLGQGNLGIWSVLGVSPHQDPKKVLTDLRDRLLAIKDVNVARSLAEQAGVGEGMFRLLTSAKKDWDKAMSAPIVSQNEISALADLSSAFQVLISDLGTLASKVSAIFVPALRLLVGALDYVTRVCSSFIDLLDAIPGGMLVAKVVAGALAAALLTISTAATVVAAQMTFASAGVATFAAAVWAATLPLLPWIAAIVAAVAAIWGLIEVVKWFWNMFRDTQPETLSEKLDINGAIKDIDVFSSKMKSIGDGGSFALSGLGGRQGSANATQNNNVNISVDGSSDPKSTGYAIRDTFMREISDASRSMPLTAY